MREYRTRDWEQLADHNGLGDFDAVWSLELGWIDALNQRGHGWSGVSRAEFKNGQGGVVPVFVKRQQDYSTRTPRHPIAGVPTLCREFHNLSLLQKYAIPTLEVLYFADRVQDGKRQTILVTRELTGFRPLDECLQGWHQDGGLSKQDWQRLLAQLAGIARQMHRCRIMHNCFFPKHVFLRDNEAEVQIRLIDLEKAKHSFSAERAMLRDLDTLNRRTLGVSRTDRLRFLLAYYGRERVDRRVRETWKKLARRMRRKGHATSAAR